MNILLTNDDGYDAPGIRAAYDALTGLGTVHVIAPKTECSACSHMITLGRPINVLRLDHARFGVTHAVEGTPADCVRLGVTELIDEPIDLVVSGINRGANAGVDVFYSGTIAGAREGAILSIASIAVSHAVRADIDIDWTAASDITAHIIRNLIGEEPVGRAFVSVNLPLPIPADARNRIRRVPLATQPMPMRFDKTECSDGSVDFGYRAPYWERDVQSPTDYSTIRDGSIAVTTIPLANRL